MRLESLKLRGLSNAFPDLVELPLRDLPEGLITPAGPNGTGKTMLLEAMGPGPLYRQLPARDGKDPVLYAIDREAFIELEFSFEGLGAFRARLNLDGPKRMSDAVLESVAADGTRTALNDGKRSTFDAKVKELFPSFDLFINSAFAAQGRGDEFTRRKPSERKQLFAEFLALQHYLDKAKAAAGAADLAEDARFRLTATIAALEGQTHDGLLQALQLEADQLQVDGGAAEIRRQALQVQLQDLETRSSLLGDKVSAFAAATQRAQTVDRDLATKRTEHAGVDEQRQRVRDVHKAEIGAASTKRETDLADAQKRIAGNKDLLDKAAGIRAAIAGVAIVDAQLAVQRVTLTATQATKTRLEGERRAVERKLADLKTVEQEADRAKRDANLLLDVPCGGEGEYAACQFLINAKAAHARVGDLERQLRPKADLADQVAAHTRDLDLADASLATLRSEIGTLEAKKAEHEKLTKFAAPLEAATARIEELEALQAKARTDADTAMTAADARYEKRRNELDADAKRLHVAISRLELELADAQRDLAAAAGDNAEAVHLQNELATARKDWDAVTGTLARVATAREHLERRRQELTAKRQQLADLRERRQRVEQELLEWRDLAKALGKGGLPDLEIDQAGPTISATTNAILLECFGPRFSVELVTQVEKAAGGMKDEVTVRVLDNARAGGWRDISDLSGGEKVIVQEALMAAISIFVNERSPMPIRTLWRDETGAALDGENAVRYISMLRKVRQLGGFHQIYFISHNPECRALADAQIVVNSGRASIVLPPFSEAA